MNTKSKQLTTDSQAVIRCLDKDILDNLGSHATFTTDELIEKIEQSHFGGLSVEVANELFRQIRTVGNYGPSDFFGDLNIINRKSNDKTIAEILIAGTNVVVLQPDGKGWQKGQIKICFEFIPEEDEPVATPEIQMETHRSPLDDIRASLIETN